MLRPFVIELSIPNDMTMMRLVNRQSETSNSGSVSEGGDNAAEVVAGQQEQGEAQQQGGSSSSSDNDNQGSSSSSSEVDQGSTGSQGESTGTAQGNDNSNSEDGRETVSSEDNTASSPDTAAAVVTETGSQGGSNSEDSENSSGGPSQTSEDDNNTAPTSTYTPEETSAPEGTSEYTPPSSIMDQPPPNTTNENTDAGPSETSPTEEPTTSPTEEVTTTTSQEPTSTSEDTSSTLDPSSSSTDAPTESSTTTSEEPPISETSTSTTTSPTSTDPPTSPSATLEPESSSTLIVSEEQPDDVSSTSTSTTNQNVAQSSTFTPLASITSSDFATASLYVTSGNIAVISADQDALSSLSSSASSSAIALSDTTPSTSSSNTPINSKSGTDNGDDTTASGGSSDGSSSRDPFLNGGGDGSGQNGRMIGGTVGGIIAAIVIVVVVVWFVGKHRRRKFVKPVVERMHKSGSGYSLPSMLNTPGGSGSGSGPSSGGVTPSTSLHGHGILTASRRRSRAFSIESASTYDRVDLNNSMVGTPLSLDFNNIGGGGVGAQSGMMSQIRPLNITKGSNNSGVGGVRRMGDEEEALFLPVGAASYPYRAAHAQGSGASSGAGYGSYMNNSSQNRMAPTKYHQQIPSGSSFGSHYNDHVAGGTNPSEYMQHQNEQQEYGYAHAGPTSLPLMTSSSSHSLSIPSPQRTFYQNAQHGSPTQELLIPPSIITGGVNERGMARSPFDDDNDEAYGGTSDPMPHSPTMVPTQLSRRTTDPFSNKHALRVINADGDHSRDTDSPTPTMIASTSFNDVALPAAVARPRAATTQSNTQQDQENSRPFSNWSSIAPSRASTSTMSDAYSTFHFDSNGFASDGSNGNNNNGRFSRADSLDANRRIMRADNNSPYQHPRLELKRASSAMEFVTNEGEILTPRQVNNVGFFRDT